jgi:hypothetical protein
MNATRIASAIALLMIAIGSFEPFYWRIFTRNRARFHDAMVSLPYTKAPGLREHYLEVRAWTRPGERIGIFPTHRRWDGGYSYIYARSLYLLSGREVVPLIGTDNRPRLDQLARADAIAVWRAEPEGIPGFTIARRGKHGMLLRRVR